MCCTKMFAPRIDSKNSNDWNSLQEKLHQFSKVQYKYLHPESDSMSHCNELTTDHAKLSAADSNNKANTVDCVHAVGKLASDEDKLIPVIHTGKVERMHIEPPLSLDKYGETIELLDGTSSSSSSL